MTARFPESTKYSRSQTAPTEHEDVDHMTVARRHALFVLFSLVLFLFALEPIRRLLTLSLNWATAICLISH